MKLLADCYEIWDRDGRVLYRLDRIEALSPQTMQAYLDAFAVGYSHVLPVRVMRKDAIGEFVEIDRREGCDETT
jgi:hypothetical protein